MTQSFLGSESPKLPPHKTYRYKSTISKYVSWSKEEEKEIELEVKDFDPILITKTNKFS